MSIRINGKEVSVAIMERLKAEREECGLRPNLAVILVGENPASLSYVASKKVACENLGYDHRDFNLPESVSESELLSIIDELNKDDSVHGILVQLPLPSHISEERILFSISPAKDVDCFHPYNVGLLATGNATFMPCTPMGILALLDYYNIETKGKKVCVVGRSNIVGKPLALLLLQKGRDATVTICNSHTLNLKAETLFADIIVMAVGKPGLLTGDMIKEGAVVIDVGTTRIEDNTRERGWRLAGDADYASCKAKAYAITPVPGGVGPMTITMLMANTLKAAKRNVK